MCKQREKEKQELIRCFNEIIVKDITEIMKIDKNYDLQTIKFNKPDEYYTKQIYNEITIDKIKPILIFCKTKHELEVWKFYRHRVSAMRMNHTVGQSMKILVQDSVTKKYLGIMCLSNDIITLEDRDKYIGWDINSRKKRLNNIMNLSICVPLQPFGYNTNGGKLLASLVFSKEVYNMFYQKYNKQLAGIITTSLYGKSIMYDRLRCFKFIGMTKGTGDMHIPKCLYNKCIEYCNKWNIDLSKYNGQSSGKLRKLEKILKELGLTNTYLNHGQCRGIYFGYTSNYSKEFLNCKIEKIDDNNLKYVKEIFIEWKERWATSRINNLRKDNRLKDKNDYNLYNYDESVENIKFKNISETSIQKYRKKQQQDNENEYKKHNREYIKQWRQNNKKTQFQCEDGSILKVGYSDIYCITNIENSKQYIGKAIHVLNKKTPQKHGAYKRWNSHVKSSGGVIGNAIKKYGRDKFKVEIICVCKTENEDELERYFIKEYNTLVPNGYNILEGGQGNHNIIHSDQHHFYGKTFSDEYKQKLSNAHKGEKNHNWGKNFNKEHKANLGQSISESKGDWTDEHFMELLRLKKSQDNIIKITEEFKKKTDSNITRDTISKIWNGTLKPIDKTILELDEYKNLIEFSRKKISGKRKFTDEEIYYIIELKKYEKSTIWASQEFEKKYNKKIAPSSVSDIWRSKVKPTNLLRNNN